MNRVGVLRSLFVITFFATSVLGVALPARAEVGPAGLTMVGSDEFNGFYGFPPSATYWTYDVGGGGWGNNEQQVYTDSRQNSKLDGQGRLVITARRNGTGYTSARLVTRGKFDFTFGYLEARIKMPSGQGLHPAFWLLGSDIGTVGWPICGEVDIIETINTGLWYSNALHGPMPQLPFHWQQGNAAQPGIDLSLDFHTYGVLRETGKITMTLDGNVVGTYTSATAPAGAQWVFDDKPMYLNLNIAVGGNWPGPTNATTPFPANMTVDWIRLYQ